MTDRSTLYDMQQPTVQIERDSDRIKMKLIENESSSVQYADPNYNNQRIEQWQLAPANSGQYKNITVYKSQGFSQDPFKASTGKRPLPEVTSKTMSHKSGQSPQQPLSHTDDMISDYHLKNLFTPTKSLGLDHKSKDSRPQGAPFNVRSKIFNIQSNKEQEPP